MSVLTARIVSFGKQQIRELLYYFKLLNNRVLLIYWRTAAPHAVLKTPASQGWALATNLAKAGPHDLITFPCHEDHKRNTGGTRGRVLD
ncbi:hypothetical protein Deipe_0056 [Deinococcus peraridilitoris DSM 19664]|uniref:Uncharacterized protein n=1 Tax=Deinococcus peraridilitoris (strain DSM 19664 / LMG 22246 / CIP 109416 / KR-200) TaxID=937777 RepID=K9ZY49_DEIPD|nr:hypothetical protein Deipe_0056 [Deinococcus peraridilitoris DSM 19664]